MIHHIQECVADARRDIAAAFSSACHDIRDIGLHNQFFGLYHIDKADRNSDDQCREKGMTVIIITHNQALAPMADRLIHIKNGQVARMESNENPTSIDEIEW